jgi:transposase
MPPRRRFFLKTELEPRLAEAQAGKRTVYFVDASHFVLASFLGWVWCAMRLFVRGASGRQRYNVLGAVNPLTQQLIRVCNQTYINSQTVCELLHKIAALGLTSPITMVLDNAAYQRCQLVQDVARQLKIELLFLPSYSPNLNLIERLWKFVKKQALHSRHHTNYADFQAAIDTCLDELATKHQTAIASLLSLQFQTFQNVPMLPA